MKELTSNQYWNKQYKGFQNVDVVRKRLNLSLAELDVYFKNFLPSKKGAKFIEIGCAPGRWMHYFATEFQCDVEGIEYTSGGVRLTEDNLQKLGVSSKIHHVDFFSNTLPLESYDRVFSFGFIEHFDDIPDVMKRHWNLVAKDGFLIVGIPNLKGINEKIQAFYSREVLSLHNLECMNLDVYRNLALPNATLVDLRYCGKLNLTLFNGRPLLIRFMSLVQLFFTGIYFLLGQRFIPDNKLWSPYIFMIYKKI
jgi:cyclopropane fatty-acyl-phospholipid synthase-like methyltransferase